MKPSSHLSSMGLKRHAKLHALAHSRTIVVWGCGEVGLRIVKLLAPRYRVIAVTSQDPIQHPERYLQLRQAGATPLYADLDQPHTLYRLAALSRHAIITTPPQAQGKNDKRIQNLVRILPYNSQIVYISTTGVYGDCEGRWIDETQKIGRVMKARSQRRVSAEKQLRAFAQRKSARVAIVRAPGIYSETRLPIERIQKKLPVLREDEDVYTNHIHAQDLARICVAAWHYAKPQRAYHACDDTQLKMGDYFECIARLFDLPLPPRLPRHELARQISPSMLDFMSESKRALNHRIKQELQFKHLYPTIYEGLQTILKASRPSQ